MKVTYFSMFSGIGGFELGIMDRGECVGYSEIDKHAIKTYEEHYGHQNYGDATTIDTASLPDFGLLVGGFPCQTFSVAGKRAGFNDTRGTLFFEVARVVSDKRPRHFILENVKGLLTHDNGKTFQRIVGVLADLGYDVEWQVLNSKWFVPQNRERVYIIGHLGGECGRKVFPIEINDGVYPEPETAQEKVYTGTQTARQYASWNGDYISEQPVQETTPDSTDTDDTDWRQAHPTRQPLRYLNRNQRNIEGDYAFTVDASQTAGIKQGERIRRLTPIECERLQGFPDNWTVGSDTQRYKQCGNAVTVNVVTKVIDLLTECLKPGAGYSEAQS